MPTVVTEGPYRVFFYSNDRAEPMHVHVERDSRVAKFWLNPVELARSGGFRRRELGNIKDLVCKHEEAAIARWNAHFGASREGS